jgi:hypothetical protein
VVKFQPIVNRQTNGRLRAQAEGVKLAAIGAPPQSLCQRHGISEQSYYPRKIEGGGLPSLS